MRLLGRRVCRKLKDEAMSDGILWLLLNMNDGMSGRRTCGKAFGVGTRYLFVYEGTSVTNS